MLAEYLRMKVGRISDKKMLFFLQIQKFDFFSNPGPAVNTENWLKMRALSANLFLPLSIANCGIFFPTESWPLTPTRDAAGLIKQKISEKCVGPPGTYQEPTMKEERDECMSKFEDLDSCRAIRKCGRATLTVPNLAIVALIAALRFEAGRIVTNNCID